MKDRIMNSRLIRWITGWRICRFAASHPVLSRFCTYEIISYLICGVLTTVVNYVTYFVCKWIHLDVGAATTISWVFAVVFAFFVNKVFVFLSEEWSLQILKRELLPFVSCRIASYFMDLGFMLLTVSFLHWNEPLMKICSNVFVMLANYFASKFLIFKK